MFVCLVWLPCLLWFRPCAPSLEVVTFSLAPSWGPLGGQVFVGFPLGLAWVVCFGVPPFLTPGCLWFAVGLFVPGGGRAPRASRRHGVVSCGRCLLLARALLAAGAAAFAAPTSLRCLFGGSSDQSPHTQVCLRRCVLSESRRDPPPRGRGTILSVWSVPGNLPLKHFFD